MSFNAKLNNVILAEFKIFCDSTDFTDVTSESLFENFKNFLNISVTSKVSTKEKKPRVAKDLPSNERCIALKADGGRCKMKKNITGVEPDLCVTHNKNGTAKNGRVPENEILNEVSEGQACESEIEMEQVNTVKTIKEKKPKDKKKPDNNVTDEFVGDEDFE